jgi:hypothetical protein
MTAASPSQRSNGYAVLRRHMFAIGSLVVLPPLSRFAHYEACHVGRKG